MRWLHTATVMVADLNRPVTGAARCRALLDRVSRKQDGTAAAAFTPSESASLLARRPYDLRHAAVSTWLNAGVPAPQVAEWAGHSVDVLLRVYAKCISGQQDDAKRRIEEATRPRDE